MPVVDVTVTGTVPTCDAAGMEIDWERGDTDLHCLNSRPKTAGFNITGLQALASTHAEWTTLYADGADETLLNFKCHLQRGIVRAGERSEWHQYNVNGIK